MATPVADSVTLSGNAFIDGLVQGGAWQFTGPQVITYSLNINWVEDSDGSFSPGPGGNWTPELATAMAAAFTVWSNVANITFQQVSSGTYTFESSADIAATLTGDELQTFFGAVGLGVFPDPEFSDVLLSLLGFTRSDYPSPEGDMFFDNFYGGFMHLGPGGYGLETMIHEIGHALGLKHPDDDGVNGRPRFDQLGISAYDAERYTVMTNNESGVTFDTGHVATPMPLDILAIQHIYGANLSYHTGDDDYVVAADGYLKTIWDAGGIDTLDGSTFAVPLNLDLSPGAVMNLGGGTVLGIAYNVTIENAFGGAGNDTIYGNDAGNGFFANAGNDSLLGGAGNDILQGNTGNDTLRGGLGDDDLRGGQGDDREYAGQGNDVLRGALGNDELRGGMGSDTLYGGQGNDTLFGGENEDVLRGLLGNDVLTGGLGADQFWFNAAGVADADTITDFEPGVDTLELDPTVFTVLAAGALSAQSFASGAGVTAQTAEQHVLYDSAAGDIFYDADGSGEGAVLLVATLAAQPMLTAGDFLVVA